MCQLKHDELAEALAFAAMASHDVTPSQEFRSLVMTAMINGRLTAMPTRTSVPVAVIGAISTISLLSKELDMDLASQHKTLTSKDDFDQIARAYGPYVHVPVMLLQSILKRLLYRSWKSNRSFSLQGLIVKFLNLWEGCDDRSTAMAILWSQLWFAFKANQMYVTNPDRSCPFSIELNRRGKFYLVYRYLNQRRRRRVIRWDLRCQLSRLNPLLLRVASDDQINK